MLRSLRESFGYEVHTFDRQVGEVQDFWFDPEYWQIRFLAVQSGAGRDAQTWMIPQAAFERPNWSTNTFPVALKENQLEAVPHMPTHEPTAHETEPNPQLEPAWIYPRPGEFPSAAYLTPPDAETGERVLTEAERWEAEHDNLRSARAFLECGLTASDEKGGLVHDLIISDDDWTIRFIVGTTGRLLLGRKVLIAPVWVKRIDDAEKEVHLGQSLATINDGPEYDPEAPVNRQLEEVIYDYLGRPKFRI